MARILIIEDEQRIASFVAKGLRAEGHQPTMAHDGPGGLDEALSGRFDLMVLDIGLPGMDGFEVLDQLRSQGSRMPVIVLIAEVIGLLVLLAAGLFGRVVLRRPWTIRARSAHGREERVTASGFRRSGELRDEVAESLRTTGRTDASLTTRVA